MKGIETGPFGEPHIAPDAFVAAGARIVGNVRIGAQASVWFNCVLRGDVQRIEIGARTNLQDGTIIHGSTGGGPVIIGADVTVGHGAILHGCVVEDGGFIGFGARVLDGAQVESGGMLGAGALLSPGKVIRGGELWVGNPARFQRRLSDEERTRLLLQAQRYVVLASEYAKLKSRVYQKG